MSLEASVVRICTAERYIVGTGVLIGSRYVLTCAHVVADALGINHHSIDSPTETVYLDFPYLEIYNLPSQVHFWKPRTTAETNEGDDIAVLEIIDPSWQEETHDPPSVHATCFKSGNPPNAVAPLNKGETQNTRFLRPRNLSNQAYKIYGFPKYYDKGIFTTGTIGDRLPYNRWQLQGKEGILIQEGFSGAPVWDEQGKGILGIVAEKGDSGIGLMIPTDSLVKVFPLLQEWVPPYPFMVDDLNEDFVQRPREFNPLQEYLLQRQTVAITAALQGAGGYGKTTLARALCHARSLWQTFPDGILWVTLGEKGNVVEGLVKLYRNLTGDRITFVDVEDGAQTLGEMWGDRRCLIVIDDVWNEAHLRPFLRGGENCVRLVTTRRSNTLPHQTHTVNVDAMQSTEAINLLRYGLPDGNERIFQQLATRLGEWPILLKLVNGVLRRRFQQQSLEKALEYVQTALNKKSVIAFDSRDAEARNQAVQATLEVSLSQLKAEERQRYQELGIFPEDVDIPLGVIEKLWGWDEFDTETLCDELEQLSLLLDCDLNKRTIRLHDVIRLYLRQEKSLVEVNQRFLDSYLQEIESWQQLSSDESYLWKYLAYHLVEGEIKEELSVLLFDFVWIQAKLEATDINALIGDYDYLIPLVDERQKRSLKLVQGALRLSSHVLKEDKNQLASQLCGRLLSFEDAEIKALLDSISHTTPLLVPKTPSLTPPGGHLIQTLTGHSDSVTAVAITPDGKLIVSGSHDHTLKIWDIDTGEVCLTLEGHSSGVSAVAITSDSKLIVSGSSDKTLKVWDLETGKAHLTLKGHRGAVHTVAITPDSKLIVSGSSDKTLKVWDLETGKAHLTLKGHRGAVHTVAITPDSKLIVSGSSDKTLKVWNLETGKAHLTLKGHRESVHTVAVTPDGRQVISGSWDNTLKAWDIATGKERLILKDLRYSVQAAMTITPDGQYVVLGESNNNIEVWNLETWEKSLTLVDHSEQVNAIQVTPDGKQVVSGSSDGTLKIWNLEVEENYFLPVVSNDTISSVVVTLNNKQVISGSYDGTLRVWDLGTEKKHFILAIYDDLISVVTLSPDGQQIVVGVGDYISIRDLKTKKESLVFKGYIDTILTVAVASDGKRIISGSEAGIMTVWKTKTRKPDLILHGHSSYVAHIAITPDCKQIISASGDKTLKVWDLETGAELFTLEGHRKSVYAVAVTPNGKNAISGSSDKTLKVWNLETGEERLTLEGHSDGVVAVAVSSNGKQVISGSWDNTLKVWDLETGEVITTFIAESYISCCAVSPNGKTIVAGEASGRLHFLRWLG